MAPSRRDSIRKHSLFQSGPSSNTESPKHRSVTPTKANAKKTTIQLYKIDEND